MGAVWGILIFTALFLAIGFLFGWLYMRLYRRHHKRKYGVPVGVVGKYTEVDGKITINRDFANNEEGSL